MTVRLNTQEKVLIVDDDRMSRIKLALAVGKLGYAVSQASDGAEALQVLSSEEIDLILLDILMPEVDGFEVLKQVKSNADLINIPVIVVSSLDDDKDSIIKAIELGAEDFLPKQFDVLLLKARINASIEKKRLRNLEKSYFNDVGKLIDASAVLEEGKYNPSFLGIEPVLNRKDSLGKLAHVFTDMAREIYERERRLNQQVRTLRGVLLLLAAGAVLGLGVPLSRMASGLSEKPVGLTVWVLLVTAAFGISISAFRRKLPRITSSSVNFIVVWGVITAVSQVILFWVAGHLQASLLSIILVTEGFIVFGIAAILGLEKPKAKRLIGLFAGFVGVLIIVLIGDQFSVVTNWVWVGLALTIPAIYAFEDLQIAARLPDDWDILGAVGIVSLVATLLLIPMAFIFDEFVQLDTNLDTLKLVLLLLAAKTLIGTALTVWLLKTSGAVFGSQAGYVLTFAGIAWSLGLLDESLPFLAWVALGIMLIGLLLVEPKDEAEARPESIKIAGNQHYLDIADARNKEGETEIPRRAKKTRTTEVTTQPDINLDAES
ncbi:MAG: response regulator [Methyloligellaceae bacterium]